MQAAPAALLNVLRCELDATNQQFVHILALRLWGEQDAAKRITEVDDVDFPNAMRIIDYLVATDTPIELAAGSFTPGTDYRSILISERVMEGRLGEAIDNTDRLDDSAQRLLEAARAPRAAYADWLDESIASAACGDQEPAPVDTATAGLSAQLITLIEQSMIHAFVQWHAGDTVAADAAWATSGAAMMHMTRLVQLFAMLPGTPVPGACPVPGIQNRAADTLDADRGLAQLCAQRALDAADRCEHETIARLCADIADYYQSLSIWQPHTPHPAADTNPPAFHSFEVSLSRFVS